MLWLIPAATALYGGLRAKKQGGSFGRGALTGGLLGAGAAYGGAALMGAGGAGAGAAGAGAAGTGAATTAATPGLLGTAGQYAKTGLTALQAAQTAQGLLGGGQQQAPQMMPQQITGPQTLSQLAESNQQGIGALMDEQMKRRQMSQNLIQQMMGRQYG